MYKELIHSAFMVLGFGILLSTATEAADPSLVGWWKLDETSGTVATDSSDYSHHGTIHGNPEWVSGIMRGAIELDGVGDYVDIGAVGISNTIPRTVAGWAKASTTAISGWTTVFGFGAAGESASPRFAIEIDPAGNYNYSMGPSYNWPFRSIDTEWHHFAIMSDGYYASGFLDGEFLGGGTGANTTTIDEVRIGNGHGNNYYFPGIIDDVRVYNKALTEEEVKEIMFIPGPEAYNPMPEDGAELSDTWVNLQWSPGNSAASHDVYLGDNFTDVNEGTGNTYRGNQTLPFYLIGFSGFAYPEGLVLGTTYYWRVDEVEVDGVTKHKGDVWSFSVLPKTAYNPYPADGAERIDPTTTFSWEAGFGAVQHQLYFGDNFDDVNNSVEGTLQTTTTYSPNLLEPGKVYYWRIDESGILGTYKGDIWSFTTGDCIVIEDFENYTDNDEENETIWQTWNDGIEIPDNGSHVGYLSAPYIEEDIVHNGSQSMPLFYLNTADVINSEVWRVLEDTRDWSTDNIKELVIWFHGRPESVGSFTEGPDGTYTMTGSGAQIIGNIDEFHYAYKTLNGAGSIVAKIDSVENTNPWARAGVMIRETFYPGSKYAMADVSSGGFATFQGRSETDGNQYQRFGVSQNNITTPHWVKLERDMAGNFTMSRSSDGIAWESIPDGVPQNIQMNSEVYIGLVVTATNADLTCEAVFSNLTMNGMISSQWGEQDIGIKSNAVEPLYVALSNNTGNPAVVYHDDPVAATIDSWTEWVIPLQKFADQGIDLTDIDRISIGLGVKGPLGMQGSGGSGVVYIDDIRLYRPVSK